MNYNETIDFLFNCLPAFERSGVSDYKPGLHTVSVLSSAFGNPQKKFPSIHIGGTNGKGSTSHTLAAILQSAGYKVGLFTSPHLVDFRERIRVNGQMISQNDVIDFVDRYNKMCLNITPSFFELTTVMAFDHFAKTEIDIAIIEVGLGGRLDSTNIIHPILSIITNISLDHTSLLGNTVEDIAIEKAGIIKKETPVIISEASNQSIREIFQNTATRMNAPISFAEDSPEILSVTSINNGFVYETTNYGTINGELGGNCQPYNASVILSAVTQLRNMGWKIDNESIRNGFSHVCDMTGLAGRWMKIKEEPLTICDTGHNPGGWSYISNQISEQTGTKHIIVGFVADKDIDTILDMIADISGQCKYYFTEPHNHRKLNAANLKLMAESRGLHGEAFTYVIDAYKKALADSSKGDFIFIGGSNYLIAELLDSIQ